MKIVEKYRKNTSEENVTMIDKIAAILRGQSELQGDIA
jgi:hypothetical protein